MEVRKATRADLLGAERVAHAAAWDAYAGLLKPATITSLIDQRLSSAALKRSLLAGALWVVVDTDDVVTGVAIVGSRPDYVAITALATDPDRRHEGIGSALLTAIRHAAPDAPLRLRILLGAMAEEAFAEHHGFSPGEVLERDMAGEHVVERAWWRTAHDHHPSRR